VFIEGHNHILDLYLMSFCKNIITANSTYSWWAAFLKRDEEGIILAPSRWFPTDEGNSRSAYYPKEWIINEVKVFPQRNWDVIYYKTESIAEFIPPEFIPILERDRPDKKCQRGRKARSSRFFPGPFDNCLGHYEPQHL
jgi:Glycosyl transferase family 11